MKNSANKNFVKENIFNIKSTRGGGDKKYGEKRQKCKPGLPLSTSTKTGSKDFKSVGKPGYGEDIYMRNRMWSIERERKVECEKQRQILAGSLNCSFRPHLSARNSVVAAVIPQNQQIFGLKRKTNFETTDSNTVFCPSDSASVGGYPLTSVKNSYTMDYTEDQ